MATIELGSKHECAGCSAKFYDMGKPAPVCPKCGIDQVEFAKSKAKAQAEAEAKVLADLKAEEEPIVEEVDEDDLGEDDEDDEDDLPIGDDEDDDEDDEDD